ncbi:MAG TPA: tyrosine-type recombinase/integrase [Dehalococcoidia bacterium]
MLLGDRRTLPLLKGCWRNLDREGRSGLTRAWSGFVYASVIDFYSYCDAGTWKGARNQALTLVLLDTGLRASELANLKIEDVDFAAQRMLIKHAKGNKQRMVRFGERTRQALVRYIRSFRGDAPAYLLLTARGRRGLNRSAMRTIFQRLGEECGIPKVHPHRFRHTFATWAIEQQARENRCPASARALNVSDAAPVHGLRRCGTGGSG